MSYYITAHVKKLVEYNWKNEMKDFQATYNCAGFETISEYIKFAEKNNATNHIFYSLCKIRKHIDKDL